MAVKKHRKRLKKWVKTIVNYVLYIALFVGMLMLLGGAVLQESYKLTPHDRPLTRIVISKTTTGKF
jgi:ABC-type iron transport system FetAB permease component